MHIMGLASVCSKTVVLFLLIHWLFLPKFCCYMLRTTRPYVGMFGPRTIRSSVFFPLIDYVFNFTFLPRFFTKNADS